MAEKKQVDYIASIISNLKMVMLLLLVFQTTVVLFFTGNNLIWTTLLFLLPFGTYFVFKDTVKESINNSCFTLTKISFGIYLNSIIIIMSRFLNKVVPQSKVSLIVTFAIIGFITVNLFYFLMLTTGCLTKIFDKIQGTKCNLIKNELSQMEHKPGDVVLCVNKETQEKQWLLAKDRFLHMLILGPTGSGKTSQTIIPMLHQDVLNKECGITVIEPKADLAEKIYFMCKKYDRDCTYFNPIMPDCPYFNPLIGREEEVTENMCMTFNSFSAGSSQFFKDANEELLRHSLRVLKRLRGDDANFIELSKFISDSGFAKSILNEFDKMSVPTETMAAENKESLNYFRNNYYAEKSKTFEHTSALRTQIFKIISNKYLRKVLNPERAEDSIDFVKHLADNDVIAIATAQGELRDLGKFLGFFVILQFQSAVFKRPGNENTRRHHYLYIDEFQKYSNPGFEDMLTQGRSYCVASHLATQNRTLIGAGLGQGAKDFIANVSTNARNIIIYPGANSEDANYYSKEFGEIEVLETSKSQSRQSFNPIYGIKAMNYPTESRMEKMTSKARFSPTDIIYRDFGEIVYRIITKNKVQSPQVGKISYIPKELNDELDDEIAKFREEWAKIEELEDSKTEIKRNHDVDEDIDDIPVQQVKPKKQPQNNRQYADTSTEYMDDIVEDYVDDSTFEGDAYDDIM